MMIIIIKRRCSIFVVIISIISPFEMQLSLQQQQKSCQACTLHIQSVYRQQDEAEPLRQPAVKGQSTGGGGYQRAGAPVEESKVHDLHHLSNGTNEVNY